MKKLLPVLILAIIIPQIAFAAWWNPFSWKIFNRIFSPKVETVQTTTTESDIEIEKLRAEIEELKRQETENNGESISPKTKTTTIKESPTQSYGAGLVKPQVIPTTTVIDRDVLYADIMQKYTNFQSTVSSEKDGLRKNSTLYTERQHFVYLEDLLNRISSDIGYLTSIKNYNPRPVNIEGIYLSRFSNLKSEYETKAKQYIVERAQNEIEMAVSIKRAEEEAIQQTLLEKQQYVQDIKVKIAEMDQLRTQIDTLAGSSLMGILNAYRKLDSELLFYTFKYRCSPYGDCSFTYPYESKYYDNNYYISNVRDGLQAIVANYRAFLNVELTKNQ